MLTILQQLANMCYQVIHTSFKFEEKLRLPICWNGFRDSGNEIDTKICIKPYADRTEVYNGEVCFRTTFEACNCLIHDGSLMLADKKWHNASFLVADNLGHIELFLVQLFYTHAVQRQMLQLHCATIEDQGRGILFLGPSGIGKTTQAERWAQYRGSSIINGDIGFVQRTPQGYTAWGTPWHGSSPYCLNTSVPVKALVVLKQAPENRLRELTGFEKVREVSGSVFYPTWLENGMELCTDTLNHLLTDLPVYRLDNRADEAAVNLLAAELDRIT